MGLEKQPRSDGFSRSACGCYLFSFLVLQLLHHVLSVSRKCVQSCKISCLHNDVSESGSGWDKTLPSRQDRFPETSGRPRPGLPTRQENAMDIKAWNGLWERECNVSLVNHADKSVTRGKRDRLRSQQTRLPFTLVFHQDDNLRHHLVVVPVSAHEYRRFVDRNLAVKRLPQSPDAFLQLSQKNKAWFISV